MNRALLAAYGLRIWTLPLMFVVGAAGALALRALGQMDSWHEGRSLVLLCLLFLGGQLRLKLRGVYPTELRSLPVTPRDLWRTYIVVWLSRAVVTPLGFLTGFAATGPVKRIQWALMAWAILAIMLTKLAISLREFREVRRPRRKDEAEDEDKEAEEEDDPNAPLYVFAGPFVAFVAVYAAFASVLFPWLVLAVAVGVGFWIYRRTPLPTDLDPPAWLKSKRPRSIQLVGVRFRAPAGKPLASANPKSLTPEHEARENGGSGPGIPVTPKEKPTPMLATASPVVGPERREGASTYREEPSFHLHDHLLQSSLSTSLFPWLILAFLHTSSNGDQMSIQIGSLLVLGFGLGCLRDRQGAFEPLPIDRRVAFDWSIGLPLFLGLFGLAIPSLFAGSGAPPLGYRLALHVSVIWFGTAGWMESHRPKAQGRGWASSGLSLCWHAVLGLGGLLFGLTILAEIASGIVPSLEPGTLRALWPEIPVPKNSTVQAALLPLGLAGVALAWWDLRHRYRGVQLAD